MEQELFYMSMRQIFKKLGGGPTGAAVGAVVGGVGLGATNSLVGAACGALGVKVLQAAGGIGYDVQKSVIDNVVGSAIVGGGLGALSGCVGGFFGGVTGSAGALLGAGGGGLLASVGLQTAESVIGYEVLKAAADTVANATTEAVMTVGQEAAATATGAAVLYGSAGLLACCCACIIGCGVLGGMAKNLTEETASATPNRIDLSSINIQRQDSDLELPSLRMGR
jgi:hypothetical protein